MGIAIDHVIEIAVEDDDIINRMSGRRVHLESGRSYHLEFNPPARPGLDDVTGDPLVQREDDQEETVRKRLDVYHQQTKPLVDFYQEASRSGAVKFSSVIGTGEVSDITAVVFSRLES